MVYTIEKKFFLIAGRLYVKTEWLSRLYERLWATLIAIPFSHKVAVKREKIFLAYSCQLFILFARNKKAGTACRHPFIGRKICNSWYLSIAGIASAGCVYTHPQKIKNFSMEKFCFFDYRGEIPLIPLA